MVVAFLLFLYRMASYFKNKLNTFTPMKLENILKKKTIVFSQKPVISSPTRSNISTARKQVDIIALLIRQIQYK